MNILAIDTATEACSVALQFNNRIYTRYEVCPQQHSQKILIMIEEVMNEAGATLNELQVLGFGRGPGSFTGVRIATGIIQGLALGAGLPVVGVSTLQAMAQQVIASQAVENVAVAIDARMGEVYFARFQNKQGLAVTDGDEQVLSPVQAATLTTASDTGFAGTGWQAYPELAAAAGNINVSVSYPYARHMLPLAEQAFLRNEFTSAESVSPVYLRDTVTWKKLPGRE
ncbi:tRNA (adenosine(37)-N6)-threonylcarbamoyltransferase complex dimerization subunit type 1 TsaB [Aestuariibacter sp. GS-14]|uniref:tRNA (adenosine(37)-N6)-threonylcarbamoyltransferase complex dimerization subunit type 1 TsaB n=1 Tax=Aestuariibacter sp. GS-14 TaxID=2590670 RepID=UPI00112BA75F|nr:tRNA (adenosine(37)-N6)-threonylcarbamoyltransferase complex dimerization subunit type 1 TsaB [Aestuariibacter sp. GS-14]TPV60693.1 tRNA (adenosine(37)-N6)-threonylcarbamoyltransferase complex dimerization subunit type 1 TsaB [Aestuariibacter sp. GS-14]